MSPRVKIALIVSIVLNIILFIVLLASTCPTCQTGPITNGTKLTELLLDVKLQSNGLPTSVNNPKKIYNTLWDTNNNRLVIEASGALKYYNKNNVLIWTRQLNPQTNDALTSNDIVYLYFTADNANNLVFRIDSTKGQLSNSTFNRSVTGLSGKLSNNTFVITDNTSTPVTITG